MFFADDLPWIWFSVCRFWWLVVLATEASASGEIAGWFNLHFLDFERFASGGADCRPEWIAFFVGCEPRMSGEGGLRARFSWCEASVGLRGTLEVHPKKFNGFVESVSDSEVDSGFILCFRRFDSDRAAVVIRVSQGYTREFLEFLEVRCAEDCLTGRIDPNPFLRAVSEGFRVPKTLVCDPFWPDTGKGRRRGFLGGSNRIRWRSYR